MGETPQMRRSRKAQVQRLAKRGPEKMWNMAQSGRGRCTELYGCSHVARVGYLQLLEYHTPNHHLTNYNNELNRQMAEPVPLEQEVARILASKSSHQLLQQLHAQLPSAQDQLTAKAQQVQQLQGYLHRQIGHIQAVVQEHQQLRQQHQLTLKTLQTEREQKKQLERQLQIIQASNDAYLQQITMLQSSHNMSSTFSRKQIDRHLCCSVETNPPTQEVPSNQLLQTITTMEETIRQLRLERIALCQPASAQPTQHGQPPQLINHITSLPSQVSSVLTIASVITALTQDRLQEIKFRGEVSKGRKQGKGVCLYKGDLRYEGSFREGRRQGTGSLYRSDRLIYRGHWLQDLFQGRGVLYVCEGVIKMYEGQFHRCRFQGYGRMNLRSEKWLLGYWREGELSGSCFQSRTGVNSTYYDSLSLAPDSLTG